MSGKNETYCRCLKTALGHISIVSNQEAITGLEYLAQDNTRDAPQILLEATDQIIEFLSGKRKTFTLTLAPEGTEFQQRVWKLLRETSLGKTTYYQQISEKLGLRNGSRAVGHAVGKNPIPILIPCHRVLGKNGRLVGYSGQIWRKVQLLEIEGAIFQKPLF